MNLAASQYVKPFDDIDVDINKSYFLILKNEMCQHLAYLHNSVNQYFPNDQI